MCKKKNLSLNYITAWDTFQLRVLNLGNNYKLEVLKVRLHVTDTIKINTILQGTVL